MSNGFILLHKKILDWEWWDDRNVTRLFIYCLLKANWSDKRWKGKVIKRGEFITSTIKLAEKTDMSRQQVRTALDKLKSTNDITKSSTSNYTRIKVNNYDDYQRITNKSTNEQPTNNQRITTTNKERMKNNKERIEYLENLSKENVDNYADKYDLSENRIRQEAEKALNWVRANGKYKKDYNAFFHNWLKKAKEFDKEDSDNPILEDEVFEKLQELDQSTDEGTRLYSAYLNKLEGKYPAYKYKAEWEEVNKQL